jgi:lipoprotein signal peptidase
MGMGPGTGMSMTPIVLLPIYVLGASIALLYWVLLSLAFALIQHLQQRGSHKSLPLYVQLLLGAAFGTLSGFGAWGLFTCSTAAWVVGGWVPCLKVNAFRDYTLSLMPGLVCGVASVLLWGQREA